VAKRKAAEIMLDELKKVHPNGVSRNFEANNISPPRIRVKNKSTIARKKPRNLVKVFPFSFLIRPGLFIPCVK
jgi:hypothetical protein